VDGFKWILPIGPINSICGKNRVVTGRGINSVRIFYRGERRERGEGKEFQLIHFVFYLCALRGENILGSSFIYRDGSRWTELI
jgi:hypothetical protein